MLLHDELGDCDLDAIFPFNYKLTVFRTSDYYDHGRVEDTKNVEFAFLGVSSEFLPAFDWKPQPEMILALKRVNSDMARALSWKFAQMLDMRAGDDKRGKEIFCLSQFYLLVFSFSSQNNCFHYSFILREYFN